VKVFSQRGQRNFRPSPAIENQRATIGQSRQIGTRPVHTADYSERRHQRRSLFVVRYSLVLCSSPVLAKNEQRTTRIR
jgi:hypothetical protein